MSRAQHGNLINTKIRGAFWKSGCKSFTKIASQASNSTQIISNLSAHRVHFKLICATHIGVWCLRSASKLSKSVRLLNSLLCFSTATASEPFLEGGRSTSTEKENFLSPPTQTQLFVSPSNLRAFDSSCSKPSKEKTTKRDGKQPRNQNGLTSFRPGPRLRPITKKDKTTTSHVFNGCHRQRHSNSRATNREHS